MTRLWRFQILFWHLMSIQLQNVCNVHVATSCKRCLYTRRTALRSLCCLCVHNSQRVYPGVSHMHWSKTGRNCGHPDCSTQTLCHNLAVAHSVQTYQCRLQATRDMVSYPICRIKLLNILADHFSLQKPEGAASAVVIIA